MSELVEIVARQLAAINSPASQIEDNLVVYRVEAAFVLRAIEGAGYKVVGREATEEMLDAMVTADHGGTLGKRSSNEWQAAFDAAPTVGGEGT